MKLKKLVLLFLALLFPACIFIFLKFFGKNEFSVPPLFSESYPENTATCADSISLPYHVHDSVRAMLNSNNYAVSLITFDELEADVANRLNKELTQYGNEINVLYRKDGVEDEKLKRCVFFLNKSLDLVLIDQSGAIRGQYATSDREEMDRLIMELAIILKRY